MRNSLGLGPQVGRTFLQRRVSWALSGLFAFTIALSGVAGAVYLSAVPGLAAVSPFAQQFAEQGKSHYNPLGPLANTSGAADGTGAAQDGSPIVAGSPEAAATLLGQDDAGALNVLAGGAFPAAIQPFNGATPSAGETPAAATATAPNSGDGNNGSAEGTAPAPAPSSAAPDPSSVPSDPASAPGGASAGELAGMDEAMEGRICAVIRDSYYEMLGYADRVFQAYDEFYSLTLNASNDECLQSARATRQLLYDTQVANAAWSVRCGEACGLSSGIYADSRYAGNYSALQHAYGALITSLYEVDHAWSAYINSADPASDVDTWRSRITLNSSGQVKAFADYERYRAGACP